MDDLISRQAAIDAIEPTIKSILQGNSFKAINVMDKIRNLPSAQQWIPCSERLPEKDGMYFVTDRNIFGIDVCILSFGEPHLPMNSAPKNKRNWYMSDRDGDFYWDDVIAWMPLPEPYKEKQE